MIDGVFVGLTTIDVIYNVAAFQEVNTKIAARSQEVYIGGPSTNAALTFSRLGGRTALVSAVGRHPLANLVREELSARSIASIDLNPDFCGVPAISSVTVDDTGRRNVVSANAARIPVPPSAVDRQICEQAKVVMVDGHAIQACQVWAAAAKSLGKPVVLDGGSWKQGTDELLNSVDTAICSADFGAPGCKSERDLVAFLQSRDVKRIAITHGAEPIMWFQDSKAGEIAVPHVEVVDTAGAGDVFHGAFCYFLAAGAAFERSLEKAAEVASLSCRFRGTREWMEHLPGGFAGLLV